MRSEKRCSVLGRAFWFVLLIALFAAVGCGGSSQAGNVSSASFAPQFDHVWRTQLAADKLHWGSGHFEFGEPVISGDGQTLFVGSRQGGLFALRTADGSVIWEDDFSEAFHGRPLLARGLLFVGCGDGFMRAIDPNTGKVKWAYDSGGAIQASPAIDGDTLVFTNTLDRIFALDASSGDFLWQKSRPTRPPDFALHGHAGVLIHEGVIYTGYSDGQLMAYALEDGATVWGYDLSSGQKRFRDVDTTPVVVGNLLYAASFTGGLHAFDIKNDYTRKWYRPIEGASQVLSGGGSVLYFTSNEGIHAADRRSGNDFWHLPLTEKDLPSRPVLSDSALLVSLRKRGLLSLSRSNGTPRAVVNPGSGFAAAPTVVGQLVFLVSNRGGIYAFRLYP